MRPIRLGRPAFLVLLCCLLSACQGPLPGEIIARDPNNWMVSVTVLPTGTGGRIVAVGGQLNPMSGQPGLGVVTTLPVGATMNDPPQRLINPLMGMLWWAHGLSDQVAWLAGENGTVIRYDDGAADKLQVVPVPVRDVLYGVWAFSDDDVWAVGGAQGKPGLVLHGGRAGLSPVSDADLPQTDTLYKVYGADPQHLFIVGASGTLLRRTDGHWVLDPLLVPRNEILFTVHGRSATDVYAVGGLGQARLLHFDGQAWSLLDATSLSGLTGVFATPDRVLVSGQRGLLASGPGPFQPIALPTDLDLHAVFALGGEFYTAGSNLSQFGISPPHGVVLRGTF